MNYNKELKYYKGLVKEAYERLDIAYKNIYKANEILMKLMSLFNEIETKLRK